MIFATRHSDQSGAIAHNAMVVCFDSQAQAESWLLSGHSVGLNPRVEVGSFDTSWRHTDSLLPSLVDQACAPFSGELIKTRGPDDHHVGNHFEHTPKPDVLVLVDRRPDDVS